MQCHPAIVDKQKLADCSKPDEWIGAPPPVSDLKMSSSSDVIEIKPVTIEETNGYPAAIGDDNPLTSFPSSTNDESQKSLVWIIVIIVVVIIVVILLVFVIMYRSGDKKKDISKGLQNKSIILYIFLILCRNG